MVFLIGSGKIMRKFLQKLPRFGIFHYQPILGRKSGKKTPKNIFPTDDIPVEVDIPVDITPVIARAFEN
jgi:hypothetical protein